MKHKQLTLTNIITLTVDENGEIYFNNAKLKKYAITKKKYFVVHIPIISRKMYVHRLVWWAFNRKPEPDEDIHHKDNNPQNNHIDNLECLAYRDHCSLSSYGENNKASKLTEKKVIEIRKLYKDKTTQVELARQFNVTPQLINQVVHRKCWSHI